jgi:threonine dehydrogenase-like Zn-dependent dehydrogenase
MRAARLNSRSSHLVDRAHFKENSTKALADEGPRKAVVKDMPDARIERPTDVLVKITTTNICGSDLHMYEGRTDMETGRILGHENFGAVVEIGAGVERIRTGDRVCLPFNIGSGFCKNCERGLAGFCLTANSGVAGTAYGFAGMGAHSGGQAEYLQVPSGDFNCLVLSPDAEEKHIAAGQANVKAYNRKLRDLIAAGKAKSSRSSRTNYRSTRHRKGTSTSTNGRKAGLR